MLQMLSDTYRKFFNIWWLLANLGPKKLFYITMDVITKRKNIYLLETTVKSKRIKFEFESIYTDLVLITEIFALHAYDISSNNVKLIVDVGANKGASAIYLSMIFPFAKLVCIEPNERIIPILKKNLELNSIEAVIIAKALTNKLETVHFQMHDDHRFSRVTSNIEDLIVPSTTVDNEFGGQTIDILKLDIEGSEESVLNSIKRTKIRNIAMEIHYDLGVNFENISKCLSNMGLEIQEPRSQDKLLNPNYTYPIIIAKNKRR